MNNKILVADDSITIQKIVAMAFEKENVTVEGKSDGQTAFDFLAEFQPNIVLADIDMPEINGFELSKKIKDSEELSSIKVLLLASDFEDFDDNQFSESKADDYISKPFKSDDIVKKVKTLLPDFNQNPEEESQPIESAEAQSKLEISEENPKTKETPHSKKSSKVLKLELENMLAESKEILENAVEEIVNDPEIDISSGETPNENLISETVSPAEEVLEEVQEEIEALQSHDVDPKISDDTLLAEGGNQIESVDILNKTFNQIIGKENASISSHNTPESLSEEEDKISESSNNLENGDISKPSLLQETLSYISEVSANINNADSASSSPEILAQSHEINSQNEKITEVVNEYFSKALKKRLDPSNKEEMDELSQSILQTIREVVKDIAPGVIRTIVQEEIDNIKKMESPKDS